MNEILKKAREALSRLNNSAWAGDLYAALDELERAQARIAELEDVASPEEIERRIEASRKWMSSIKGANPTTPPSGKALHEGLKDWDGTHGIPYAKPPTVDGAGSTVNHTPPEPAPCRCGFDHIANEPLRHKDCHVHGLIPDLRAQLAAAQARVKELETPPTEAWKKCVVALAQDLQAATERAEKAERDATEWKQTAQNYAEKFARVVLERDAAEATAGALRAALKDVLNAAPSDRQRVWNAARAALAAHSKAVGP